jgi:hypothetical protein
VYFPIVLTFVTNILMTVPDRSSLRSKRRSRTR